MRLGCLLLALTTLPLPASAQSLGAAARKEEERRQKNREKGVQAPLFDDSKISKKVPASPAPSASPGAAPAAAAPAAPASTIPSNTTAAAANAYDAEVEERRQKEEMWRGRMAEARAKRDQDKARYEELNALSLAPREYFVDDKGKVLVRDVEHLRQLIAEAKACWEASERAIVEVEDAGRRAGALPGWLR